MSDDRLVELAPLAALGALDGEDRAAFESELAASPAAQRELAAFEEIAGRIGLASAPVAPSLALRGRVLAAAAPTVQASARRWAPLAMAAALIAALAGVVALRAERDAARREVADLNVANQAAREEMAALRQRLAREAAVRELLANADSRVASLAGLPAAPGARARVVWNAARREAVLLATGLPPAPAGKAYEVWVIAAAAPVPAGVFQVDAEGKAVFHLPALDDIARVKTFAVTLEPAGGVPAPTGPMVLAGAAS